MNMMADKKNKMRIQKMVSIGSHLSIPTSSTGDTLYWFFQACKEKVNT